MRYLIDTNVISEFTKPHPNTRVMAWLDAQPEDELLLSVMTIAEIRYGIESMAAGRRRRELEVWTVEALIPRFHKRILPISQDVANTCGILVARSDRAGRPVSSIDAFIAATATVYALPVVTRNVSHYEALVADVVNPWDE